MSAWLKDAADLPLLRFPLPPANRGETAMILAELYRYQGQWKFRAVGQGFSAGLPALAAHFGIHYRTGLQNVRRWRFAAAPLSRIGTAATGSAAPASAFIPTATSSPDHHVIEGASEITARSPRHRCRLETVFADRTNDLALLRADPPPTGIARFQMQQARLGEIVIVVGYPLGGLLVPGASDHRQCEFADWAGR